MNVDLLRKVDFYVGVPSCMLLSLWDKTSGSKQSLKRTKPKNAIFLKLLGMGSIILARPLLTAFSKKYPKSDIYFITFSENAEIVKVLGIPADHILVIERHGIFRFIKSVLQVLFTARRLEAAFTFDLEFFSRFTAIFTYLIGSPRRIGFSYPSNWELYRGSLHTDRVSYSPYRHTADAFLDLAESSGIKIALSGKQLTDISPINPSQDIQERLPRKFPSLTGPYIVFNINAGEMALIRRWPKEKFTKLIKKLLKRYPRYRMVLIGGASDILYAKSFSDRLHNKRVIDLSGQTSLRELLALFSRAAAFITNDSGPMHLAGLTGVPMVALFGPETPQLYRPLSENCEVIYRPGPRSPCLTVFNSKQSACLKLDGRCSCMAGISVEEVYRSAVKMVHQNRRPPKVLRQVR